MNEKNLMNKLLEFNQIYKEMDIIYHNYAKKIGVSDASFWVLYSLIENDELITQAELCSKWCFPPQTVNSAIKELIKRDIICFEIINENKKNKYLKLTEKGKIFIGESIDPLIKAESDSFLVLSEDECNKMLSSIKKYELELKRKITKLENVDEY